MSSFITFHTILNIYFIFNYICLTMWEYVHVTAGASGVQQRALNSLELELQVVVNCPAWVVRTKLGTSTKNSVCSDSLSHLYSLSCFFLFLLLLLFVGFEAGSLSEQEAH